WNPKLINEQDLPRTLKALADPKYKGKVAVAPADSDFLPLVRAMDIKYGKRETLDWLRALSRNAQIYSDDEGVTAAVEKGAAAFGDINNYYFYRLREQIGAKHMASRVQHFTGGVIGGLVNVSGAAVMKYGQHPKLAQRLLAFMVSKRAQTLLARSDVDFEYPLRPGVPANPQLRPFDQLQPPDITVAQLGSDRSALDLLQESGLL
ncbi:MAG TPA: extracellular solute-binding protein, partial [Nevskiaceae bacterium]